jgi:hypothetical protein
VILTAIGADIEDASDLQATELAPDMLGKRKPIDVPLIPADDLVGAWSCKRHQHVFTARCTLISLPSAGLRPLYPAILRIARTELAGRPAQRLADREHCPSATNGLPPVDGEEHQAGA